MQGFEDRIAVVPGTASPRGIDMAIARELAPASNLLGP